MNILMHGSSCEPHFMLVYRTSDDWRSCVIAGAPMSSYLSSRVVMNTRNFFSELCITKHYDLPLYSLSGNIRGPLWTFWCMAVSCEPHFMPIYRTSDDWCTNIIAGAPMSSYLSNKFRSWLTPQQSQFPGLWYTGLESILHSFLPRSSGPCF